MTSHYDDDAFELTFENAVFDAHTRADRGNAPSGKTWETIRREISSRQMRAETADPRALGPDLGVEHSTMERTHRMDAAIAPQYLPSYSAKSHRLGWMTLMAAGLVGLMIITSLWINGGSPGDDPNDLAWAPGMGTPESSPIATGACKVEPLTVDEVMETVMNPNNGYNRLGDPWAAKSDSLWEPADNYVAQQYPTISDDPDYDVDTEYDTTTGDMATELETVGNDIWDCLESGTTFQVWAILDPTLVQLSILDEFPVIREESAIRAKIMEVGPLPFSSWGDFDFSDWARFATARPAEFKQSLLYEHRAGSADAQYFARIDFQPNAHDSFEFRLFIREISPDVWIVYGKETFSPE